MNPPISKLHDFLSPLIFLSANWLSRAGVTVVTSATVLWIYLLPTFYRGEVSHPYAGILIFLILPGAFVGGLVMIPLGMFFHRRRARRRGVYPKDFPPPDLRNPEMRRLLAFIGVATVVNTLIGGHLTYSAVNYMDSVTFCGQTCHTVMAPEFTAYQNSPHARVDCVECHIGPGASWFVRSKLSGVQQAFAVTFHTYDRPIPTPVRSLRPARETCEACHWPQKFEGDRLRIIPHFAEDETNSSTKTVLLLHIGGAERGPGIHGAHLGPGIIIRYGSDESRQKVFWVELHNATTGRTNLYMAAGARANPRAALAAGRVMDCVDCHNRPTHIFELPERALDRVLATGELSPALPFVKKTGLALLKAAYPSRAEAALRIPTALAAFYKQNYPALYPHRAAEIARAARVLVAIYLRNVFPEMKVAWGTYPNNIGHTDFPGCFRCHDNEHSSSDGKTIPQDCSTCHNLLAMDDPNPKILTDLGIN